MPTKATKSTAAQAKNKAVAAPVPEPVKTNEASERQSQFATILIGLLIIAAGLLIYNYFQNSTAPKTSSEQASATPTPTAVSPTRPQASTTPTPTPAPTSTPAQSSSSSSNKSGTYTVKAGDSVWKVAEDVYGDGFKYGQIVAANHLGNDAQGRPVISAGQVLIIPNTATVAAATTTTPSTAVKAQTHLIQHGETLWSIAQSVYGKGSDWILIYNDPQNHLSLLPDGKPLIHAGNILYLPAAP